jgi:hypothetical protein
MDINVYLKTLQDNKDKVIEYASKRINIQRAVKLTVASFVAYYTLNVRDLLYNTFKGNNNYSRNYTSLSLEYFQMFLDHSLLDLLRFHR